MKMAIMGLFAAALLTLSAMPASADDERSYTEGNVIDVTAVKVKPGMFDAYLKWLDTTYKQLMEEQKKAGIIVDYSVYAGSPRTPQDPDLYLVTTYKNMAALDNLDERTETIMKKIWSTRDAANKADAERGVMREILGDELIRELKLK
jgi:L-rhamnose mutarotase